MTSSGEFLTVSSENARACVNGPLASSDTRIATTTGRARFGGNVTVVLVVNLIVVEAGARLQCDTGGRVCDEGPSARHPDRCEHPENQQCQTSTAEASLERDFQRPR